MTTLLMIFVWFDTILLYINITHYSCVHIINAITLMWSYHWYFLITDEIISLAWSYHWCDHASKMISLILKSFCWHDHIIDMSFQLTWLIWLALVEVMATFDCHDRHWWKWRVSLIDMIGLQILFLISNLLCHFIAVDITSRLKHWGARRRRPKVAP